MPSQILGGKKSRLFLGSQSHFLLLWGAQRTFSGCFYSRWRHSIKSVRIHRGGEHKRASVWSMVQSACSQLSVKKAGVESAQHPEHHPAVYTDVLTLTALHGPLSSHRIAQSGLELIL